MATIAALDEGRGAAAVEEEHHLLAGVERGTDGPSQRAAEDAAIACLQLLAQVDDFHRR